ncbi:hypothetical protein MTR_4g029050 [Medicago truncatula]|uniref:Uncharacterized protein n=1 Tax=Medicago truncatula TaxID=3880 RepID=A0A072UTK0_MEDTR|nr:hypothetical protein MTR_4g029050 [Medicago truncatula]
MEQSIVLKLGARSSTRHSFKTRTDNQLNKGTGTLNQWSNHWDTEPMVKPLNHWSKRMKKSD